MTPSPLDASGTGPLAGIRPESFVGEDADANERTVRSRFLSVTKRYLRRLPVARHAVASYYCMLDSETPTWVRATVAGALAYLILPADAIADVLPLLGLTDDAGVILAAVGAIGSHLGASHFAQADAWLRSQGAPVPDAQSDADVELDA